MSHSHFKDKEAIDHVVEAQAKGIVNATEIHGAELPGHLSAATDSAKETAIALAFAWALFMGLHFQSPNMIQALAVFALAWMAWKAGRSALLGWARLERLHRIVAQEKWEIDHHRTQEREELGALYHAKGFEGKLLEDVLDVLMADNDRLLMIMVEEELGLSLRSQEHPLRQALGAAIGAFAAALLCLSALYLFPTLGLPAASLIVVGASAALAAHYEQNAIVPAVVWNIGLVVLTFGIAYFLISFLHQ